MQANYSTFTVLIAKISQRIRKLKTEEVAEFELKSSHVSCLYYLYLSQSLTATQLCDMCGEDKAAISRAVDCLEQKGLVECASHAKKRYNSPLRLTEKGMEVSERIAVKIDGFLQLAGEGLSEEKRAVLYESLMLINENLEKICKKYGE